MKLLLRLPSSFSQVGIPHLRRERCQELFTFSGAEALINGVSMSKLSTVVPFMCTTYQIPHTATLLTVDYNI